MARGDFSSVSSDSGLLLVAGDNDDEDGDIDDEDEHFSIISDTFSIVINLILYKSATSLYISAGNLSSHSLGATTTEAAELVMM